jgi:Caspase domain
MNEPVFDRRKEREGKPGLHALIIGVSDYPHLPREPVSIESGKKPEAPDFGLRPLASTSLAAFEMYKWLLKNKDQLAVPLTTCRLLLTPSEKELDARPEMKDLAVKASKDNLMLLAKDWRGDSCTDPRNMTWFYFAGHGVERGRRDHIMLMDGFGDGLGAPLHHGVVTASVIAGMAPAGPHESIAKTQLYFIDACRTTPERFTEYALLNVGDIWEVYATQKGDRACPTFYATTSGKAAYAVQGEQTVFGKALLACLNGEAAVQEGPMDPLGKRAWCVTTTSLNQGLDNCLQGTMQQVVTDNTGHSNVIAHLKETPMVGVSLRIIPAVARQLASVVISDASLKTVKEIPRPVDPHPYETQLPAGLYRVVATITPPTPPYWDFPPDFAKAMPIEATHKNWAIVVGPRKQ